MRLLIVAHQLQQRYPASTSYHFTLFHSTTHLPTCLPSHLPYNATPSAGLVLALVLVLVCSCLYCYCSGVAMPIICQPYQLSACLPACLSCFTALHSRRPAA
jgi:hypothetical protein